MAVLQKQLDQAWENYGKIIQSIADAEWNKNVKPYLDKYGIAFSQVNGDWWVTKDGEDYHITDFHPDVMRYRFERSGGYPPIFQDAAGQQVLDVLEALVPGQSLISLAIYMPSYIPAPSPTEVACILK